MSIIIHAQEIYDCSYTSYDYEENDRSKLTPRKLELEEIISKKEKLKVIIDSENIKVTKYDKETREMGTEQNYKIQTIENNVIVGLYKPLYFGSDQVDLFIVEKNANGGGYAALKEYYKKKTLDGDINVIISHYYTCEKI